MTFTSILKSLRLAHCTTTVEPARFSALNPDVRPSNSLWFSERQKAIFSITIGRTFDITNALEAAFQMPAIVLSFNDLHG